MFFGPALYGTLPRYPVLITNWAHKVPPAHPSPHRPGPVHGGREILTVPRVMCHHVLLSHRPHILPQEHLGINSIDIQNFGSGIGIICAAKKKIIGSVKRCSKHLGQLNWIPGRVLCSTGSHGTACCEKAVRIRVSQHHGWAAFPTILPSWPLRGRGDPSWYGRYGCYLAIW